MVVTNGRLQNKKGDIFEFEILLDTRGWERVVAPFARNLKKLGIDLKTRVTDLSLYKQRIDNFDYDMLVHWYLSGKIQAMSYSIAIRRFCGSKSLEELCRH